MWWGKKIEGVKNIEEGMAENAWGRFVTELFSPNTFAFGFVVGLSLPASRESERREPAAIAGISTECDTAVVPMAAAYMSDYAP